VVQLDVGKIARVAGDVGDQEAGWLRGWEHRSSPEWEIATVITIRPGISDPLAAASS
jgi:hypothetical protein